MTKERALELLEEAARGFEGELRHALLLLLGELQERRASEEPLTLGELKGMDGEPVWVSDPGCWALVCVDEAGRWAGVPFVCYYRGGARFFLDVKKRRLKCYRTERGRGR